MTVRLAKYAGFCPGVRSAVEKVYALTEKEGVGSIYTLGELIHNPHIIVDLAKKGVRAIEESDLPGIAEGCSPEHPVTVVIRTHGVPADTVKTLTELTEKVPGFSFLNCTCPFVEKIHRIAAEKTDEGIPLLVFGDPDHPEVRGILGYAAGEALVVGSEDDSFVNLHKEKAVLVSQTTQSITLWKKCQEIFKHHFTNGEIYDTICSVTENRQTETEALAREVDVMLVVGGRQSSNTKKLAAAAKLGCKRVYLLEDASEIPPEVFSMPRDTVVGITAGASTPGSIIQEVYKTMSEIQMNEDFELLLNESFKTLNTGDIVKGVVTSVSPNELKVDLSAKVTGIVPFDEITDDSSVKLADLYKVGDEIEAQAFRVSDVDGMATLSIKRIQKIVNWRKIVAAKESEETLEGKVTEVVKGGVLVSCMFSKIFIPGSLTTVPKGEDLGVLKGETVRFKIVEIDESRNRAVGSMRLVAREERRAKLAQFWDELEVGKKFVGKVKSLTSYGAFVDLGGIDGMVHVTELSWKHIKNPAEAVSVGDEIEVFVKSFNPETKRISLGYKTEETNPWTVFTSQYQVGDVASVKIVSLMSFGAFAEVVPGADGLIHISQVADHKVASPAEVLEVGQVVDAKIVAIDEEKKKISLSIRALLEGEETEEAEEAAEEVVEEVAETVEEAVEATDAE